MPSRIETHLEYYRRRRGLTQRQLARLANLSQNDISGFERGRVVPVRAELERLAYVLGLPVDAVMQPVMAVPSTANDEDAAVSQQANVAQAEPVGAR